MEEYSWRLSFTCGRCEKRATSASVRFLGRRVYVAVMLMLVSPPQGVTACQLCDELGVPIRTLSRWRRWWRTDFLCTAFWPAVRSRFLPPLESEQLPGSLFRPSASAQMPKLREAIRSLKLAHLAPRIAVEGLIRKAEQSKVAFEEALVRHGSQLEQPSAEFNIQLLARQMEEECVWPTSNRGARQWGGANGNELGFCTPLISRITADVNSPHLACVFQPLQLDEPLTVSIDRFLRDNTKRVLRVSMEYLPFEHSTRELVANAVGRHLLRLARQRRFKHNPLVVLLDEAHQFLDKNIGDEFSKTPLDAFGLIAKEGRKYCLTCVLATQRPRDIPEDVLSQMGMFIVHRLINERDRTVVEKACGNLDAAAAAFLPTLGQGEAIVVGVDSPMPLPVLVRPPRFPPQSKGAQYERLWGIPPR